MEQEKKVVGSNLRMVRELRNYNQAYLAKQMGVSRSTIASWESGVCEMKLSTLNKLAEILNFGTGRSIIDFDVDKMINNYLKP